MTVKFDRLLFDADILCHKAACISQVKHYSVTWPDGNSYLAYRHIKDAKEFIEDKPGYSIKVTQEPLPFEIAAHAIESMITRASNELGCSNYTLMITDEDKSKNYRYDVCSEYKANRKNLTRPFHYKKIRKHLIENYPTEIATGWEADDSLGIAQVQSKERTCIVSIDKDLLMVPGFHYNMDTRELIEAKDPGKIWLIERKSGKKDLKGYGYLWFCAQMILGDAVDNIFGIKGIGAVKTYKLFSRFLDKEFTLDEPLTEVLKLYRKYDKVQDFEKNARLLWILRTPEQIKGGVLSYLCRTLLKRMPHSTESVSGMLDSGKDSSEQEAN